MFLAPNETAVRRLIPFLQTAPPGLMVSVGTERAFMAAANSPSIDSLIIIDRNESIVIYNKINILLLKIAKDREHYLRLRLQPTPIDWSSAAQEAGLSADERQLLSIYMDQWKQYVSEHRLFESFHRPPKSQSSPFAGANYLFDETSFRRIQKLAFENRIDVRHFNLEDTKKVSDLVVELKKAGTYVAVLDISNAYLSQYISREGLAALLTGFNEVVQDQSLLVTTESPLIGSFRYTLYSFKQLRNYKSFNEFASELRRFSLIPRSAETRLNPVGILHRCQTMLALERSKNF